MPRAHHSPITPFAPFTALTLASGLLLGACVPPDSSPEADTETSEGTTESPTPATSGAPPQTGDSTTDDFAADGSSSSGSPSSSDSSDDSSSTGTEPPSFPGLQACMEQLVDDPQLSAVAASVVQGDQIVWSAGFGSRHPDMGGTVDEHTRFRVASVTKMMTAMAALAQADNGNLDLDAPMGDVLPPFGDPTHPEWIAGMTTRQLVSHQAGLLDYLTLDGPRGDDALANAVLGPLFTQVPFLVEPGVMWNYSNANYSVAGMAVEQAASMPYRSVVQQRVFDPLGMDRSTFDVDAVDADGNYAWGIYGQDLFGAVDYDNGWARPAGYAWSTAEDLGQLARLLLQGDPAVLSEASYQQLMTPQIDTQLLLDRMHYGLGLFHADFIPTPDGFLEIDNIDHGGNLPGYTTLVHVTPELDLGVALVANGDTLNLYPCVAAALDDLPDFELDPVPPDNQAELTVLDDYVGDYSDPAFIVGDFSISSTPTGLEVSFPELDALAIPYEPALDLYARDNFIFTIQGTGLSLTGIRGDDGSLQYVRTRVFVGHPTPAMMPAEPRRPDSQLDPQRTRAEIRRLRWDQPSRLAAAVSAR
ncbi:MAG: serine hydrolase domain-containing protein [Myxococcota bacterium]